MSYLAAEHPNRIAALIYLEAAYRYAYDVPGEFESFALHQALPRNT
jgi:hypothetical protein